MYLLIVLLLSIEYRLIDSLEHLLIARTDFKVHCPLQTSTKTQWSFFVLLVCSIPLPLPQLSMSLS